MLAGVLCLLVLSGAWLARRSGGPWGGGDATSFERPAAWGARASRREKLLGLVVLVVAASPLAWVTPWLSGGPPGSWGDSSGHARIGADLARHGLPHGWLDGYLGGFPFAHHYPPLGWLATAALVRLGAAPENATALLGAVAIVGAPISVYLASIRCGARPAHAILGALLVAWVSPYSPFVGGYEVFFELGLLSQALATPLCVLLAGAVAKEGSRWGLVAVSALTMATHPQLAVCALLLLGVAAVVAGRLAVVERLLRAGVVALAVGVALYGQGILTLDVPFGWPSSKEWLHLGYPADRLAWWIFDGDLLDRGRAPALTAVVIASALACLLLVRRAAARAALAALLAALLLAVSGASLSSAGRVGAAILSVAQPLRMVAMVPLVAGASLMIVLEEWSAVARQVARPRLAWLATAVAAGVALLALPSRVDRAARMRAALLARSASPCGPDTPEGYDRKVLRDWLATAPPGRLWYAQDTSALRSCALADGMELVVPGPIAIAAAVGAHVGVEWLAFRRLDPHRDGAAARADALGVRYLLRVEDGPIPPGFRSRHRHGSMELLEREPPPGLVGAGCIRTTWSGSDAALRARIEQTLLLDPPKADGLLDPRSWTALVIAEGPVRETSDERACESSSARIEERPREPGAVEAKVSSDAPVDVAFRVTAFPSWRVAVDGVPTSDVRKIAPGFFAVRLPPGEHRVVAEAGSLGGYGVLLALALLVILGCGLAGPTLRTPRG